jgi:hypothetical protein
MLKRFGLISLGVNRPPTAGMSFRVGYFHRPGRIDQWRPLFVAGTRRAAHT